MRFCTFFEFLRLFYYFNTFLVVLNSFFAIKTQKRRQHLVPVQTTAGVQRGKPRVSSSESDSLSRDAALYLQVQVFCLGSNIE